MLITTGLIETSTQVAFDCWFDSTVARNLPQVRNLPLIDLIVGSIRLLLQHLCVVCLPVLLEFDGLVAAGWGGGNAPPALLEAMPVLVAAQMTSAAASCCGPDASGGGGAGPTQDAAAPGAGHGIAR